MVVTTKSVEYWVYRNDELDEMLPGRMWNEAQTIATNPPDDVTLVERVARWGNDAQGVIDVEYTVLYERGE